MNIFLKIYLLLVVMFGNSICFAPLRDQELEHPKIQIHYQLTGESIKPDDVEDKISDDQYEAEWIACAKKNAAKNQITLDKNAIEDEKWSAAKKLNQYRKQENIRLQQLVAQKEKNNH